MCKSKQRPVCTLFFQLGSAKPNENICVLSSRSSAFANPDANICVLSLLFLFEFDKSLCLFIEAQIESRVVVWICLWRIGPTNVVCVGGCFLFRWSFPEILNPFVGNRERASSCCRRRPCCSCCCSWVLFLSMVLLLLLSLSSFLLLV